MVPQFQASSAVSPQLDPAAEAARIQMLKEANINPRTGLATDYLNHFNEAIMLLEMIPDMPECAEDFLGWEPRTYQEHFAASNLKARDLTIRCYEEAPPALKTEFDRVVHSLSQILIAVSSGMREGKQNKTRVTLAVEAIGWIKPLLAEAGALIHGMPDEADVDSIMEA